MVKGLYFDSLEQKFNDEIQDYKLRSEISQAINNRFQKKIENQSIIILNNERSISILNEQIKDKEKRLKRAKWHKIILGAASVASSVAIILK